jgi:hypothetical protein
MREITERDCDEFIAQFEAKYAKACECLREYR